MKNELHQATENVGSLIGMKFSPLWIKAKVALLFESISTLFLLPPKPPGSNFDSFITKNSPVPLAGMYFVLFTIMYHNCVFINKCLQLLPHFIKIWLPQILGIFTALPGNWWFKQSHQTWTSLHSLLFSGLCITSLSARSPTITLPPCPHTTQLLTHLFWLNNTSSSFNLYLAVIAKPAQSLYSSPVVPQFCHLGYSCNSGIALPCKKLLD